MKKILIVIQFGIFIFFFSCSSSSLNTVKQNISAKNSNSINIEKWKRATINIECATDSKSYEEQRRIMMDNIERLERGEISLGNFNSYTGRDIRFQGTALFVEYRNKKFLVTARHVLHDTLKAKRYIERRLNWDKEANYITTKDELFRIIKESEKIIFEMIFRVRSLDEFGTKKSPEFLMNLGAGPYSIRPYRFSEPEIDMAVISLEREQSFIKNLETNGYHSIKIDSIWNYHLQEGDDIFCIGYPVTTSPLIKLNQNQAIENWSSSFISLPTISFGKVAMNNNLLIYFWGDISIYPGNSGGPVIKDDNLVGVVSGQPLLNNQNIPFAYIIKIDFLKPLLESFFQ